MKGLRPRPNILNLEQEGREWFTSPSLASPSFVDDPSKSSNQEPETINGAASTQQLIKRDTVTSNQPITQRMKYNCPAYRER